MALRPVEWASRARAVQVGSNDGLAHRVSWKKWRAKGRLRVFGKGGQKFFAQMCSALVRGDASWRLQSTAKPKAASAAAATQPAPSAGETGRRRRLLLTAVGAGADGSRRHVEGQAGEQLLPQARRKESFGPD